ncbi:MAG: hypothetical protein RLZ55_1624, partial [Actinomycetota bacterium]
MDPIALALAQASQWPTFIADARGARLYANAAWLNLVDSGEGPEGLRALINDPEDRARLVDALTAAELPADDPTQRIWVRIAARGDVSRWWTVSRIPVFGPALELTATITSVALAFA